MIVAVKKLSKHIDGGQASVLSSSSLLIVFIDATSDKRRKAVFINVQST